MVGRAVSVGAETRRGAKKKSVPRRGDDRSLDKDTAWVFGALFMRLLLIQQRPWLVEWLQHKIDKLADMDTDEFAETFLLPGPLEQLEIVSKAERKTAFSRVVVQGREPNGRAERAGGHPRSKAIPGPFAEPHRARMRIRRGGQFFIGDELSSSSSESEVEVDHVLRNVAGGGDSTSSDSSSDDDMVGVEESLIDELIWREFGNEGVTRHHPSGEAARGGRTTTTERTAVSPEPARGGLLSQVSAGLASVVRIVFSSSDEEEQAASSSQAKSSPYMPPSSKYPPNTVPDGTVQAKSAAAKNGARAALARGQGEALPVRRRSDAPVAAHSPAIRPETIRPAAPTTRAATAAARARAPTYPEATIPEYYEAFTRATFEWLAKSSRKLGAFVRLGLKSVPAGKKTGNKKSRQSEAPAAAGTDHTDLRKRKRDAAPEVASSLPSSPTHCSPRRTSSAKKTKKRSSPSPKLPWHQASLFATHPHVSPPKTFSTPLCSELQNSFLLPEAALCPEDSTPTSRRTGSESPLFDDGTSPTTPASSTRSEDAGRNEYLLASPALSVAEERTSEQLFLKDLASRHGMSRRKLDASIRDMLRDLRDRLAGVRKWLGEDKGVTPFGINTAAGWRMQ